MSSPLCLQPACFSSGLKRHWRKTQSRAERETNMKDTLKKFSGRADDYVAGRPAYAEEFVRWLALEQGFSEETIVGYWIRDWKILEAAFKDGLFLCMELSK